MTALQYQTIDQFPLKWRFAEGASKWTVLPPRDLKFFKPLAQESAKRLWSDQVSPHAEHLMQIVTQSDPPDRGQFGTKLLEIDDNWTIEQEHQRISETISRHVVVNANTVVHFFWDATCAVETNWDVLSRYWSDFCYPSDDSNVAVIASSRIYYIEGVVWLDSTGD